MNQVKRIKKIVECCAIGGRGCKKCPEYNRKTKMCNRSVYKEKEKKKMSINRVQSITFTSDTVGSKEELWECVTQQIKLLMKNRYICTIREEEHGIVTISYNHDRPEWGCAYPYWLYPEEEETIVYNDEKEGEVKEKCVD